MKGKMGEEMGAHCGNAENRLYCLNILWIYFQGKKKTNEILTD